LGEILGINTDTQIQNQTQRSWLEVERWGFEAVETPSLWGKLAVTQLTALVEGKDSPTLPPTSDWGVAIALLPLILYYHEAPDILHRQIQQALSNSPPAITEGCQQFGHWISLALREQALLPEVLKAHRTSSLLFSERMPAAARVDFPQAIVSHPFQITLLRVARHSGSRVETAIAGALAGSIHSLTGLPPSWRQQLQHRSIWDLSNESELLHLADRLFVSWSGIHLPFSHSPTLPVALPITLPVTAAPQVIRPPT
jgi:hypothetical protein